MNRYLYLIGCNSKLSFIEHPVQSEISRTVRDTDTELLTEPLVVSLSRTRISVDGSVSDALFGPLYGPPLCCMIGITDE